MITLNLIPLSELEHRSKRFKNAPKPKTEELERFKNFCEILLKSVPQTDNERQVEDKLTDFLANSFYDRNQLVPNVDRKDYVIKSKIDDTIKVIIELKKQQSTDFPTNGDCNKKALHELIKYFFDEKYKGNNQIKTLIATNGTEFYIFEAGKFNNVFAEGSLYKQYQKVCSADYGNNTNAVYELAKQHISSDEGTLDCIYFDISDYKKHASKLYRLFSPAYLLGEITHTDANDINKNFYNELLHIIGLEERKAKGNKITICRKGAEKCKGSLFELALYEIQKKTINEEKAEAIALQLCIQWINRLLFLKLLETQICKYKESNKKFLDCENIRNFNDLDNLFFKVLGIEADKREQDFKDKFPQVPYLNSSLFEPNEAEDKNIFIRALNSNEILPFYPQTCLVFDKKNKNQLTTLQYLLKFLDSYDFGSTVNDDNADNEKIINASILGRIFEKINGYKDGAVFTPSFITMYMCRETLQRAVIDKFNEKYGWKCADLTALYNNLDYSRHEEYNETINSLTVCDPAVGSGHFLVSALNEIIRIKSELGLLYHKGRKIKCSIDIQNDELVVSRGDEMFRYDYKDPDSQEIQECLFNEKKTIIENCLFGTDINPNSVNICRLRLWIELLKNTYYKLETGYKELETLPNIDINIKCGNSLISAIKIELGKGAEYKDKSIKSYIKAYKDYVRQYKETKDKGKKTQLNTYISNIKKELTPTIQLRLELSEADRIYNEEQQKNNIYKNSLEWMIEFPEILDDKGRFRGFDVVIGNPPYMNINLLPEIHSLLKKDYAEIHTGYNDLMYYFIALGIRIISAKGIVSLITSNYYLANEYAGKLRFFLKDKLETVINFHNAMIFKPVKIHTAILSCRKKTTAETMQFYTLKYNEFTSFNLNKDYDFCELDRKHILDTWLIANSNFSAIIERIKKNAVLLGEITEIEQGSKSGKNDIFTVSTDFCEKNNFEKEILRKNIKNSDIKQYIVSVREDVLIYTDNLTDIEKYPNIYSYLLKHKKELSARNEVVKGAYKWHRFDRPRNRAIFDAKEKIVVPYRAAHNRFAYDNEQCFNDGGDIRAIVVKENSGYSIKFLLGLLNSKLLDWFYGFIGKPKGNAREYFNKPLAEIPIPQVSPKHQDPIIALADKILDAKKADPQADTSNLEHQIDLLVYKLYGLTCQEAKTIDPNLTETEYKYGE